MVHRLDALPDYAFPRLNRLLEGVAPHSNLPPITMSIGEPAHPVPDFVAPILQERCAEFGRYPPIGGSRQWQEAVADWIRRRYRVAVDPERHLLPLCGTREGLFNAALAVVPERKAGQRPAVLMPNPFYQCYAAAALSAGADPVYVPAEAETGFLPDFAGLDPALLARTALIYFCSPANPQGSVADRNYLRALLDLARAHDAVVALDECYCEIYFGDPPIGGLEIAGREYRNLLVFHSLSKRSNLPGLRSGFVAGDPELIARYGNLRNYGGAQMPLPIQAVSAAAWSDETHVKANRALYAEKFALADRIIGDRFGYRRPAGGFYLWLDVGDGEAAARRLWREAAIKVLPGAYLAQSDARGVNPAKRYIRVALVHDAAVIEAGLTRLVDCLAALPLHAHSGDH